MSERKILEKLIEDGKDAEKKLAELDEPKLRHGDYGVYIRGEINYGFHVDESGVLRFKAGYGHATQPIHETARIVRLGNIFADLTELAKPLEMVEVDDGANGFVHVKLCDNNIILSCSRSVWFKSTDQFDDFIMQCRRLKLTVENKCRPTE